MRALLWFSFQLEDGHWILYCLNLKNKKILFYDPYRPGSREATCEATNAYLIYLGIIAPSSPWPCQVLGAVDFADLPKMPQDSSFDSGMYIVTDLDLCPQRIAGVISYNTQYAHNDDDDDDDNGDDDDDDNGDDYDDGDDDNDEMMMIIHTTDP
jgi:hypothetical protein